jgi:hypothetical protein
MASWLLDRFGGVMWFGLLVGLVVGGIFFLKQWTLSRLFAGVLAALFLVGGYTTLIMWAKLQANVWMPVHTVVLFYSLVGAFVLAGVYLLGSVAVWLGLWWWSRVHA